MKCEFHINIASNLIGDLRTKNPAQRQHRDESSVVRTIGTTRPTILPTSFITAQPTTPLPRRCLGEGRTKNRRREKIFFSWQKSFMNSVGVLNNIWSPVRATYQAIVQSYLTCIRCFLLLDLLYTTLIILYYVYCIVIFSCIIRCIYEGHVEGFKECIVYSFPLVFRQFVQKMFE